MSLIITLAAVYSMIAISTFIISTDSHDSLEIVVLRAFVAAIWLPMVFGALVHLAIDKAIATSIRRR